MRRRALGLLLLAGCGGGGIDPTLTPADLALPPHPPPTRPALPEGLRVRAGTYNVHGGGDGTPAEIGAALAALELDLVGLEECPDDVARQVAEAAGLEHHAVIEGRALLSRGPISAPTHHPLQAGRAVLRADVALGGRTFSVYVAHIGWNAEGDLQARELVDTLLAPDPNPYLVMVGDFNDEHLSSQNRILESVVVDAMATAGLFPGRLSWPATGFDGSEGSQLIDLVFFAPALRPLVLDADVVNLVPPLSDHKPAWAELLFPADGVAFAEDPLAPGRAPRRALPPEAERPANRLQNPGAEAELTGWTPRGGFTAAAERDHQTPRSGARLFTGFPRPQDDPSAWATQAVDLTADADAIDAGLLDLGVEGWMATGFAVRTASGAVSNAARPYDDAELLVRLLDAQGGLTQEVSSGRRDTLGWFPWAARIPVPPGTRRAEVVLYAHHRSTGGVSDDAVFDDLYLGLLPRDAPHPGLGPERVVNGGAEAGLMGWSADGFAAAPDQTALGFMVYPPWTASGGHHFVSHLGDAAEPVEATMTQPLDLAPWREAQEAGALALRWGGRLRTLAAVASVQVELTILDADGAPFATLTTEAVQAAEWCAVEALTRIPRGASGARLTVRATRPAPGAAAFVDALYARPERVTPPGR
jgi:maltose 6'-phosphate phosphatase